MCKLSEKDVERQGTEYFLIPEEYEGRSREERLSELREKMREYGFDGPLYLDDGEAVSWLFNLRSRAAGPTLAADAKARIDGEKAALFTELSKLCPEDRAKLEAEGIELGELSAFPENEGGKGGRAGLKPDGTPLYVFELVRKHVKSESELENIRAAHIKEGAVAAKLIFWLKRLPAEEKIKESDVVRKLEELRAEQEGYICPSFETIAAYRKHGTVFHYTPGAESDIEIERKGFLLLDFGGQYMGGTTDCTRTFAMGELGRTEKRHYTAVLKANLALGNARFPKGMSGVGLDALAREAIYAEGLDFGHGTGHGVGYMLNVHESPACIRTRIAAEKEDILPIEEGMVLSNEPGIYIENEYGIRLENLICARRDERPAGSSIDFEGKAEPCEFLRFETLSLVPFEREAIDLTMLGEEEKKLIDSYHAKICELICPLLSEEEAEFLKELCEPLEKERYKFHQHRACEFFPCHATNDPDNFNCIFCYCPLYALGKRCGGNFKILENGFKDCSGCMIPHNRAGYEYIINKYSEIIEVAMREG